MVVTRAVAIDLPDINSIISDDLSTALNFHSSIKCIRTRYNKIKTMNSYSNILSRLIGKALTACYF